jgi:transposase, IS5 family
VSQVADVGKTIEAVGLGDLEVTGRLRDGHFLGKIDSQIDWQPFEEVLASLPHQNLGHPSWVMCNTLFLQKWYGLSNPVMEEAICERLSLWGLGVCLLPPRVGMKP